MVQIEKELTVNVRLGVCKYIVLCVIPKFESVVGSSLSAVAAGSRFVSCLDWWPRGVEVDEQSRL